MSDSVILSVNINEMTGQKAKTNTYSANEFSKHTDIKYTLNEMYIVDA